MGLIVHNINCGSPAVADDKLVLSLSKHGLDTLIKTCYRHSSKSRYEHNPQNAWLSYSTNLPSIIELGIEPGR